MYTGIIHHKGTILSLEPKAKGYFLSIEASGIASAASIGASVNVHGVCLTVFAKKDDTIIFEIMPVTVEKTTLGTKNVGDRVNIESSLRVGDEVGGHFVYGHVDDVGEIVGVVQEGDTALVTVTIPEKLRHFMTPQGSIALDGVSLTIAALHSDTFTVSFTEYTQKVTTFGSIKKGDRVNIECDMLAKYIYERHNIRST